jgi:hypothetical protein
VIEMGFISSWFHGTTSSASPVVEPSTVVTQAPQVQQSLTNLTTTSIGIEPAVLSIINLIPVMIAVVVGFQILYILVRAFMRNRGGGF